MLSSGFVKLFCFVFNGNTTWRNVFKGVLPDRLKNSHSGDRATKKATASSQLEHYRERVTWLVEISPVSWEELFISTDWHAYHNFQLLVLFHWDVLVFSYPERPFSSSTWANWWWAESPLDRRRPLKQCQTLVFIWPMNSQFRWQLFKQVTLLSLKYDSFQKQKIVKLRLQVFNEMKV